MNRQLGGLGVLRGVFRGFSEEARTRGFASPSLGGFGFIGVASDPIIAARGQLGGWSPMSAFLQSGRSDAPKSTKTKVRFRPGAAARPHAKC